jgi:hypothetical protein
MFRDLGGRTTQKSSDIMDTNPDKTPGQIPSPKSFIWTEASGTRMDTFQQ